MIGRLTSYLRREGGTAASEFALVAPILITLLFGATDYGVWAFHASELVAAARAGVEFARANWVDVPGGTQTTSIPSSLLPQSLPPGATAQFNPNPPLAVCTCFSNGAFSPTSPANSACSASCAGTLIQYVQVNAQITGYKPFLASFAPWANFGIPSTLSAQATLRTQ